MVEIEAIEVGALTEAKPFVVVGIPAFNEEQTIARVILEAQKFANAVVVCDDGSTDYTARIAECVGAHVVRHAKNSGYGASIRSLFDSAHQLGADILVTLDADGQHDPKEIPDVIKPIIQGKAEIVIGSRFIDAHGTEEMPIYRRIGANLIAKLVNVSSKNGVKDAQSGFRAYSSQALKCLSVSEDGMGASVEILLEAKRNNLKVFEVSTSCKYDIEGIATSTKHPLTHGMGVIGSIIRLVVEERPLMVLGIPGIFSLFTGIFFGIWMLQIYAVAHDIVTNIALACIGFVFLGSFMMSTAITLYAVARLTSKVTNKS